MEKKKSTIVHFKSEGCTRLGKKAKKKMMQELLAREDK